MTRPTSLTAWNRRSWVESANDPACGFPLQSLPYCVLAEGDGPARLGVGIGNLILDLRHASRSVLLEGLPLTVQAACQTQTLNSLMACAADAHTALRARLMHLLGPEADQATQEAVGAALIPKDAATLLKPVDSANYTDFYASIHHATRVGRLFRPENPLLPNYKFVPIGYHGRASSLVVSGTPVRRPRGQTRPAEQGGIPSFAPTRFLDYEVEIGIYIAEANPLGEPVPIRQAANRIFGLSLVNDWSARDIQSWENQPLGPFLAKSFATSVGPWVVPMAALAPFRVPAALRPTEDPAPLSYLLDAADQDAGAIDLTVEAWLLTSAMRQAGHAPHRLSQANLHDLYWTPAQLIAHHASNGCNLLPGDLLATGTVSGRGDDSAGCLLELTAGQTKLILLPNGESRTSLEDGDEVILRGFCRREGFPDVSLGECRGSVMSAQRLDL
ncbi:MAG TPA: fumarylacetoacetase [Terracidiphilus sp.]